MAKTVLIVEDNNMNMQLFSDLLTNRGYDVIKSVDGSDCVELAKQHRPGLIVMDIQLPNVSGLERTKQLKADKDAKDIPVLAVTAFDLDGGLTKILESGCDDMLGKPIKTDQFLEVVGRYF